VYSDFGCEELFMWIFRRLLTFDAATVNAFVPNGPGVYIIHLYRRPFYVGRSRVNIRERLLRHVIGAGSTKIAEALAWHRPLEFEFEEMISPEQAESVLIQTLGTRVLGNLRSETDPADW
jgi:hypothetical protein